MTPEKAYEFLKEHSIETAHLGAALSLLHWDQRTMMPKGGHPHRAEQIARLTSLVHRRNTDPARGEAIAALGGTRIVRDPLSPEAANVREWRRAFYRDTRIPERLAVELARACAESETAWETARPAGDWKSFAPHLERVLTLRREQAECLGYEDEPYDALLEEYEPGERAADLEPLFAVLRERIVALLDALRGAPNKPDGTIITRRYPVDAQRSFSHKVIEYLGFTFDSGRLDESAHPFSTSIGVADARITTRYDEHHFNSAFFGSVHETGHSLYELGLDAAHWGTPMGMSGSLGVHESQSRLWENFVARSRGFWRFFYPDAQQTFEALRDVDLDEFHLAVNEVAPSLIRVEADEVTYNLHVMLRFELELALLRGDLQVGDLPGAWDEKMQAYLGVRPENVADGVMQDVHWPAGLIGYFPTYTLGNLYAAQLYAAAEKDMCGAGGSLEERFGAGEFAPLLGWLREKVHAHGMRYLGRDLMREATGEDRSPEPLADYLDAKFKGLYGV